MVLKKGGLLFFLMLFLSFNVFAGDCKIYQNSCPSGKYLVSGLELSYVENAHVGLTANSNYPYVICCDSSGISIGSSLASKFMLKFNDNSHISIFSSDVNLNNQYLIKLGASVNCEFKQTSCLSGEFCLFSLSNNVNAHVSSCEFSYPVKLCCVNAPPVETHLECLSNVCAVVNGAGSNLGGCLNVGQACGNESNASVCGNGIFETGEECEFNENGILLGNNNCKSFDYDGGRLSCYNLSQDQACKYNKTDCVNFKNPPQETGDTTIIYTECIDDGDGDDKGVKTWKVLNQAGTIVSSGSQECTLAGVPFSSSLSIILVVITLIGFYFFERFKYFKLRGKFER